MLFVARDFELKGGGTAMEICRRVRQELPTARLLVAGSTDPDPRIDGVSWLGPTTRDDLYRSIYAQADVFVYPTTFDAVPLVVAEALANGLPVVAPALFGLTDQVVDGETGVLYRPGDVEAATHAVLGLLRDPGRLSRMSTAAVGDFSARMSSTVRNRALYEAYRRARFCAPAPVRGVAHGTSPAASA